MRGDRAGGPASLGEQLHLVLGDGPPAGRLPDRIAPMLASHGVTPFDDQGHFFEPWWPGARAFAFAEAGRLRIQTDHLADPLATFPELAGDRWSAHRGRGHPRRDAARAGRRGTPGRRAPAPATGRSGGLRRRGGVRGIGPAVGRGSASHPAAVRGAPLAAGHRPARRAPVRRQSRAPRRGRDARGSGGVDGPLGHLRSPSHDSRYHPGDAGEDWLRLPVVETPAPQTRPLLVLLNRLPLDPRRAARAVEPRPGWSRPPPPAPRCWR